MELKIKTTKTFTDILGGPRICILQGGTRSAKSYSAVQYCVVKALETPNTIVSIVRKSFPSLRISTLRDFRNIMKELNLWDENRWYASENVYNFENGSFIEFLSIQDSERRKGTKRNILFIDEVNELSYEDWFQTFIRTTDKAIVAYNPSFSTSHWIYNQVHTHPEAQLFISTYQDNPFLEDDIVREIERLKDISPSYWTVYGEGKPGMVEGLVFDNVSMIDYIEDDWELLGYGLDFGYSQDPTALVALFRCPEGIVFDEVVYMKGLLSNEITNLIRGAYNTYGRGEVIADSQDPRLIEEIFRGGVNIKPAVKGPDSILAGIDLMKQHRIFITKKSQNMVDEFLSYTYAKDKNGNLLNIPIDYGNHTIDACRYVSSWKLSQKKKNHGTYNISIR